MSGQEHGDDLDPERILARTQQSTGAALRALHAFLVEADKKREWGGLLKTVTPDGNILWLCGRHRQPYEERMLVIEPSEGHKLIL